MCLYFFDVNVVVVVVESFAGKRERKRNGGSNGRKWLIDVHTHTHTFTNKQNVHILWGTIFEVLCAVWRVVVNMLINIVTLYNKICVYEHVVDTLL